VARLLALGALGATIAGVVRARRSRVAESPPAIGHAEWPPLVAAVPPSDRADTTTSTDLPPWVESVDGKCPPTHLVKGNASSGIYHVPGSRVYDMTIPERCYRDTAAAEADGMRAPKR